MIKTHQYVLLGPLIVSIFFVLFNRFNLFCLINDILILYFVSTNIFVINFKKEIRIVCFDSICRFRHLDTMVRLKTGGTGSRRGSSNGCSPDLSPSASPSRGRSPNGRA